MRGVGRTAMQLLCSSDMQRWTLAIGLSLTLVGVSGLATAAGGTVAAVSFALAGNFGVIITAAPPVVLDGFLFRSISAPRRMVLIPRGRLQLLLGALATQLLVALFIALSVGMLMTHGAFRAAGTGRMPSPDLLGRIFVIAFSALTVQFLAFYYASRQRLGVMIAVLGYTLVPMALGRTFPGLAPGAVFADTAGFVSVLAATLLAWLAFALAYLRSRHIAAPRWSNATAWSGTAAWSDVAAWAGPSAGPAAWWGWWASPDRASPRLISRRSLDVPSPGAASVRLPQAAGDNRAGRRDRQRAVEVLLAGAASSTRLRLYTALTYGAALGYFLLVSRLPGHASGALLLVSAGMLSVVSGPVAASLSHGLMWRAKSLWLRSGLDRMELFRTAESQAWRWLLAVIGTAVILSGVAVAIAALIGILEAPSPARITWMILMPPASGAAMLYLALSPAGRRLTDIPLLVLIVLLILANFAAVLDILPSPLSSCLLGVQIILVAPLRALAQRRWQSVDWLINKAPPPALRPA